jgi:mannose-6-phosphate isomerase-like protein (cupin superfamily)
MSMYKVKEVKKPWGKEVWLALTKYYCGKLLMIKKGHRLSRQYHKVKHETLYTHKGKYILELKKGWKLMKPGMSFVVKPKTIHRMYAKFGDVVIIEVSTPEVWDVVRLSDDYGRNK